MVVYLRLYNRICISQYTHSSSTQLTISQSHISQTLLSHKQINICRRCRLSSPRRRCRLSSPRRRCRLSSPRRRCRLSSPRRRCFSLRRRCCSSLRRRCCSSLRCRCCSILYCQVKPIVMECVVQGIIETQHVEALEILLQGICGVNKKQLKIHELCLKSSPNLGNVSSEVRLICDLEQPEPTWLVRHIGGAMRGAGADQISVLVRNMVESKASKNALRLFYALGYKLDHELLRVGFSFQFYRGAHISVTVSSVNKMSKLHAIDDADPVTPGIQLVEVTAIATSDNYGEVVAAVSSFCEYLSPLLHLSKPGVSTGVVPTAAAAAASLMSDGGGTTV